MRRRTRGLSGMPLLEWNQQPLLEGEVRRQAIDALADLLLEALQGPAKTEGEGDESQDHA
ncbi:MAG TPA: hypothetical protein VGB31_03060 [Myxococcota bacterium]